MAKHLYPWLPKLPQAVHWAHNNHTYHPRYYPHHPEQPYLQVFLPVDLNEIALRSVEMRLVAIPACSLKMLKSFTPWVLLEGLQHPKGANIALFFRNFEKRYFLVIF